MILERASPHFGDARELVDYFETLSPEEAAEFKTPILGIGGNVISTTGPSSEPVPFTGREFPTFFRIAKEPKNGLVKNCPLNRTIRVDFDTDAANGYFERSNCPGSIVFDPPNLNVSTHLWDGKFTVKFQMPYDAGVGHKVKMRVTVSDIERETKGDPFVPEFTMVGSNEAEDVPPPPPGTRPQGNKPNGNGKHSTPVYASPDIREVRRAQWDDPQFKFDEFSALRIVNADENNGFIFFVNMDNQFLIHELHKAKDEGSLIKHWFKYGVVLSALGILKELQRLQQEGAKDEENGENDIDLEKVGKFCAGLARVVVPMIRALYKGPAMLASTAVG